MPEPGPSTLGLAGWAVRTARLMVGVPDYGQYVAHMRATHPELEPMSYEAFFRDRQNHRDL